VTAEKRFVPWVSLALLVANLGAFALTIAKGGDVMNPSPALMLELGGNFGPITLDGEPWRLFTSMFLHYGLIHLAMNMFLGLYQFGQITERLYGHAGFAAAYVVAGLGGSLASAVRGQAISVGASGAVFGIIGAFLAYLILHRKRFDRAVLNKQFANLAFLIGLNVWLAFQVPGIDQAAHIGGLVTGFVVGLALELGQREGANRLVRAALVGVLGTGAIIGASFALGERTAARIAFEPGTMEFGKAEMNILDRWVAFVNSEPPDDQIVKLIDDLLPEWEAAQVAYVHAGGNNPELLRYINLRRDAWIAMRDGLRQKDQATFDRGLELFKQADELAGTLGGK
jgi:rhomboid protease GluP